MKVLTEIAQIDEQQWEELVEETSVATWFQTREAYEFFASLPEVFMPFVVAVERSQGGLRGVIVGYVTREQSTIKQFFTRRAIIMGGPLLAEDIMREELIVLLRALNQELGVKNQDKCARPIYIESRNFNDYSRWKETFEACGFAYQPHLNFHVDTSSIEVIETNMWKSRKRDIRTSEQAGTTVIENPTIEQVRVYYHLLQELYRKKIRTPLFPWEFFERLYYVDSAVFLLIEKDGEIIGGGTYVRLRNNTLYAWWGCGKDGVQKGVYPLFLANYMGMRYAAERGMPRFDMMGAGKPNEKYGVRESKKQFGGKLVEHGRFLCVRNRWLYKIGSLGVRMMRKFPR